jgi:hypothetical protein
MLDLRLSWELLSVYRSVVDTDSMGSLGPDPDSQSGSGTRRAKITQIYLKTFNKFLLKCWMFSFEG